MTLPSSPVTATVRDETEITGTAHGHDGTVRATVFPGGALSELVLSAPALELGPAGLAAAILDTVAEATAAANQRTKHALRDALAGLGEHDLDALGLHQDHAMTERVEGTTPQTWRAR